MQIRAFTTTKSAIHAFPRGPPVKEKKKEEYKEGRPTVPIAQDLTFRKYRLLPEIISVLENQM